MSDVHPGGAVPTPRITAPSPGGHVRPGADAAVTVTSNAPDLPLELLLLSAEGGGNTVARTEIAPGAARGTYRIAVPPDPGPNQPVDYYLAVGVRAELASEQNRHVIPVTTRLGGG